MLQSIRDRTHGWIAGIIISLIILSFALWGIHSYLAGGTVSSAVAKVNGVPILRSQYSSTYDRLRSQFQLEFGQNYAPTEQIDTRLKDQALQSLISIQVLKQASVAEGFMITNRQIDSILVNMTEFQVDGRFSQARFQQQLTASLYNASDFLELIRTSLLIDQPRLGVLFSSFSLPNEVNESIGLIRQERKIAFITFPEQYFLQQGITVSDQAAQDYFAKHSNEYKTPEQVSVEYVSLSMKDLAAQFHPSEKDLKSFYDDNINSFTKPGQWHLVKVLVSLPENATQNEINVAQAKIENIAQQVLHGADFTKLAAQYPAEKGPDWVTLNQVSADLQKAVSGLTKVGQVTGPIRTNSGFVLLKALDIKHPVVNPFAEVKSRVQQDFSRQMAEQRFAEYSDQLDSLAYEHPDSLAAVNKKLGLQIHVTGLFTQVKGGIDISQSKKIRDAAFSDEVLNQKTNSKLIQMDPETVVVLRIKSHVPTSTLPFSVVKKQIIDKLKVQEAETQAEKTVSEIIRKLQSGVTPAQIATQYHVTWHDVGFVGRHVKNVDPAISDAVFRMPRPDAHPLFASVDLADGFAVVQLNAVRDGSNENQPDDQYQVFAEQVQNSLGMLDYELYKQSLTENADIDIENQLKGQ